MAQISVTGTVVDETGVSLPGVNITIQGSNVGVVSDNNGRYTISVPNRESVLSFSFVGYSTVDYVVGDNRTIDVTLREDAQEIEEVVVIGYGTVRKSDLTGSVVSISSEKFKNLPQGGVTNILQGKAAGVNITSLSGTGHMSIRIRGITSINKSGEPLWVVDGVIGGVTGHVNDIQSIEVLKDASATAIYGSQGANGVILVTTKRPQEGPARVTFDTRLTWNTMRKQLEMLSPWEYGRALMEFGQGTIPAEDMEAYKAGTKGINWFDEMTQTGFSQGYSLSVSGGSPKTRYRVTANASDGKSQWVTRTSRGYSVKANLDIDIAPWVSFSGYAYGGVSNSHNEETGYATFENMLQITPCMEMTDENGVYQMDPFFPFVSNPMSGILGEYTDRERNSLTGFGDLKFKLPIDGLTLSIQGLYSQSNAVDRTFRSSKRNLGASPEGQNGWSKSYSIRNVNNLTYQKQFGDHRVTASAVMELVTAESSSVNALGRNLIDETLEDWNIGASGDRTISQGYNNSAMVSAFGRIVYSYKSKYLFTGTYRADAPSQFRDKYKWGYFPSAAVGWNISEEDFFPKELIQQMKLRASVGVSGNHRVDNYSVFSKMQQRKVSYATGIEHIGYMPGDPINTDIRWEKTLQYNIGVDFGVWDRRINTTIDWFQKNTNDLLWKNTVPMVFGGGDIWVNEGALTNNGWEFTVDIDPFRNSDFTWNTTLTASYNDNKLTDLAGKDEYFPDRTSSRSQAMFLMRPGLPIGTFYIFDWLGYDDKGANLYRKADGSTTFDPSSGDRFVKGYSFPKWTFGWNNQFSYKNFDLNIFFRATGKYSRMNLTRYFTSGKAANSFITLKEAYFQNWDKVSDKSNAKYGSFSNPNTKSYTSSTQWMEQSQFLRLQNVTLGYRIPKATTTFVDIYLSLSGQNLFVLSKYTGMDPETVSSYGSDSPGTFGLDVGSFPLPRSFMFTARFDF